MTAEDSAARSQRTSSVFESEAVFKGSDFSPRRATDVMSTVYKVVAILSRYPHLCTAGTLENRCFFMALREGMSQLLVDKLNA